MDSLNKIQILRGFFKDSTLMDLYAKEQQKFSSLGKQEEELSDAMSMYHQWFPKQRIPEFRMHLSAFAQSVITSDKFVSVAGDKFMGADCVIYKSYFYSYQLPLMQTESLVANVLKALIESRFPESQSDVLLDKMIYRGVEISAVRELLPNEPVERLLDYNASEWQWLSDREKEIWIFMVENEQLYSTDALMSTKYMEEAPFTSFFGQNSPSRIGCFVGYQIVQSYLKKKDISASQLLGRVDSQKILTESGYRP